MSDKDTQDDDLYEEFDDGEKVNHTNDNDTKRKNKVLALQNLMRAENGREWVWAHLVSCGVFESGFDTNMMQSAYNAGLRDAGLKLQREVKEAASGDYLKMIKENIDG